MDIFRVGGAVRDEIMGRAPKDFDFAVEADSFEAMKAGLEARGFEIFLETPQYLTIRARFPKGQTALLPLGALDRRKGVTADFVLCRKDGEYGDGRRPDTVEPGSILDDLSRRDFRMNAVAVDQNGRVLDPFLGVVDIRERRIACVGKAEDRIGEDPLRLLRAVRFSVTLGFTLDKDICALAGDYDTVRRLTDTVSVERIREELVKMFRFSTRNSLKTFDKFYVLENAVFSVVRLEPTLKGV